MPVNFRPQDFPKYEVEAAIGYAERSFQDVSDPVPDFSVLTLGAGPGETSRPRSCWATKREARVLRRGGQEHWSLDGLLWEVALRVRARRRRGARHRHARTG